MCSSRRPRSKRERTDALYINFHNHYVKNASPRFTSSVCHKRRRRSCRYLDAERHLCAVIDFSICPCNRSKTNALVRLAESPQLVLLVAELKVACARRGARGHQTRIDRFCLIATQKSRSGRSQQQIRPPTPVASRRGGTDSRAARATSGGSPFFIADSVVLSQ
jgi:hypothetical protein